MYGYPFFIRAEFHGNILVGCLFLCDCLLDFSKGNWRIGAPPLGLLRPDNVWLASFKVPIVENEGFEIWFCNSLGKRCVAVMNPIFLGLAMNHLFFFIILQTRILLLFFNHLLLFCFVVMNIFCFSFFN